MKALIIYHIIRRKGYPTEGGFKKWSAALSMGGGAGGGEQALLGIVLRTKASIKHSEEAKGSLLAPCTARKHSPVGSPTQGSVGTHRPSKLARRSTCLIGAYGGNSPSGDAHFSSCCNAHPKHFVGRPEAPNHFSSLT